MYEGLKQSQTTALRRRIYFSLVDATTAAPATGKAGLTGYLSKNGGTPYVSPAISGISDANMPGRYYVELAQADTSDLGSVLFHIDVAGCLLVPGQAVVTEYEPLENGASTDETATAVWAHTTRSLTTGSNIPVTTVDTSAITTAVWAAATRTLTGIVSASVTNTGSIANQVWLQTTRSLTATDTTGISTAVWAQATRSLTTGSNITAQATVDTNAISTAVWAEATRSLTTGSNIVASATVDTAAISTAVWAEGTRTLTGIVSASVTNTGSIANQVWLQTTRSLTTATQSVDAPAIATAVWNASGRTLTSIDTTAIATGILDAVNGIETGITLREAMRLMTAVLVGRVSGAETATITFRDINNTKNRVVATGDNSGNRTSITIDPD
jgi:hypothetical protein